MISNTNSKATTSLNYSLQNSTAISQEHKNHLKSNLSTTKKEDQNKLNDSSIQANSTITSLKNSKFDLLEVCKSYGNNSVVTSDKNNTFKCKIPNNDVRKNKAGVKKGENRSYVSTKRSLSGISTQLNARNKKSINFSEHTNLNDEASTSVCKKNITKLFNEEFNNKQKRKSLNNTITRNKKNNKSDISEDNKNRELISETTQGGQNLKENCKDNYPTVAIEHNWEIQLTSSSSNSSAQEFASSESTCEIQNDLDIEDLKLVYKEYQKPIVLYKSHFIDIVGEKSIKETDIFLTANNDHYKRIRERFFYEKRAEIKKTIRKIAKEQTKNQYIDRKRKNVVDIISNDKVFISNETIKSFWQTSVLPSHNINGKYKNFFEHKDSKNSTAIAHSYPLSYTSNTEHIPLYRESSANSTQKNHLTPYTLVSGQFNLPVYDNLSDSTQSNHFTSCTSNLNPTNLPSYNESANTIQSRNLEPYALHPKPINISAYNHSINMTQKEYLEPSTSNSYNLSTYNDLFNTTQSINIGSFTSKTNPNNISTYNQDINTAQIGYYEQFPQNPGYNSSNRPTYNNTVNTIQTSYYEEFPQNSQLNSFSSSTYNDSVNNVRQRFLTTFDPFANPNNLPINDEPANSKQKKDFNTSDTASNPFTSSAYDNPVNSTQSQYLEPYIPNPLNLPAYRDTLDTKQDRYSNAFYSSLNPNNPQINNAPAYTTQLKYSEPSSSIPYYQSTYNNSGNTIQHRHLEPSIINSDHVNQAAYNNPVNTTQPMYLEPSIINSNHINQAAYNNPVNTTQPMYLEPSIINSNHINQTAHNNPVNTAQPMYLEPSIINSNHMYQSTYDNSVDITQSIYSELHPQTSYSNTINQPTYNNSADSTQHQYLEPSIVNLNPINNQHTII